MSLTNQKYPLTLKDKKENINSTKDDVRGDILRPAHGPTSAV